MTASSPSFWRRVTVQMSERHLGQDVEAFHRVFGGLLHLVRRGFRCASEHGLRIVHDLSGKLHRITDVRGHMGHECGDNHLHGHKASGGLWVVTLPTDFVHITPRFTLDRPKKAAEIVEPGESRLADERRKVFQALRRIEGRHIRASLTRLADCEAQRFMGFGHVAEDVEHDKLKREDLAPQVDFEILTRFERFRHVTVSDLGGVSPEDYFVLHFADAETRPPP